ncbi:exopolyphosphatase [Chitinivorax sp. B]|uniref:exopolyphosphatase n=1 Tax=Chitinivorax sp. B TaxID=2502235 RepID=UPI0010F5D317|nr:exopolyphosphatase [Chitinivorax sp. B]
MNFPTIAAVDLGSNSFRLQVARVVDDQIYPLDTLKDPVRLGAGLTADDWLEEAAIQRAVQCLRRFGERLRGLPKEAVRIVGTNTLRVALNASEFMPRFEQALGDFPIEIIAGREEARLIYLGAAHSLPATKEKRLVIDIGGGSTEFIIGSQLKPQKTESLYMGCVSYTRRFFPDGKITKQAMRAAELAARNEIVRIVGEFHATHWQQAVGTSGTARSLADIMELNDLSTNGITAEGMERVRDMLLAQGNIADLKLNGLRPDRAPVIVGGFCIMYAAFAELGIKQMITANGALREGVLWDLLGRHHHKDMRDVTVAQFKRRYHVDIGQTERVMNLAVKLYLQLARQLEGDHEQALQIISWAAKLHEIGLSVSHTGYHKHSAYILENADMPGFSKPEQLALSRMALAHRGNLGKQLKGASLTEWSRIVAIRLGALFFRSRMDVKLPDIQLVINGNKGFTLTIDRKWLEHSPLTDMALKQEAEFWQAVGLGLEIRHGKSA